MAGQSKVELIHVRTTPGTYLFSEVKPGIRELEEQAFIKIGSLYVKKRVFEGQGPPHNITVTIDW